MTTSVRFDLSAHEEATAKVIENQTMANPEPPLMMPQKQTNGSVVSDLVLDFFGPEIRSWHGEQPLRTVFWSYGVLTSSALSVLYALSIYGGQTGLQQALLPFLAGYTFWMLVSLWRSSKPVMNTLWGALARQLAVVWALNVIMILTFLQFELVEEYLHYGDGGALSVPAIRCVPPGDSRPSITRKSGEQSERPGRCVRASRLYSPANRLCAGGGEPIVERRGVVA